MAANLLATIAQRVGSLCAGAPFGFIQAQEPFSFALQPTGAIDQVFRIENSDISVSGGTNYSETRIGQLRIFIARKQKSLPQAAYTQLSTDAQSLTAAITRDGVVGGGDYDVPDAGRGFTVQHDAGKEYAVLRLTLPIGYEAQL
jgi:hypothetical protein